ncbi:unnamed protein product [Amoebophrya sp. A25]|nr:unnamed protein product [Amoebophrya sp. A25]|eukprot:GSA25T00019263001.1
MLQNDERIVLASVAEYGGSLMFASSRLRGLKNVVLAAVSQSGLALQYASDDLKADKDVVLAAMAEKRTGGSVVKHISTKLLDSDQDVATQVLQLQPHAFSDLPPAAKNLYNSELAWKLIERDTSLLENKRNFPDKLLENSEFLIGALKRADQNVLAKFTSTRAIDGCHVWWPDAPLGFSKSKVAVAALEILNDNLVARFFLERGFCRWHRSSRWQKRFLCECDDVTRAAIKRDGSFLRYGSNLLLSDRDVVLEALCTKSPSDGTDLAWSSYLDRDRAWERVGTELKQDRDLVLKVVERCGKRLEEASETLRDDEGIVLAAVGRPDLKFCDGFSDPEQHCALRWASQRLRAEKKVVLEAVTYNSYSLKFASPDLRNDREVVMAAVSQNGNAFQFASEDLRSDKDIAMNAVATGAEALKYASPELTSDRELVAAALALDGRALRYASASLKDDKDLVLAAVKSGRYKKETDSTRSVSPFQFASPGLQRDKEFIMTAVTATADLHGVLTHTHHTLLRDKAFIIHVLENLARAHPPEARPIAAAAAINAEWFAENLGDHSEHQDLRARARILWDLEIATQNIDDLPDWRGDEACVLAASLFSGGSAMKFAREDLKSDKDFILSLAKELGVQMLQYASTSLLSDSEFLKKVSLETGEETSEYAHDRREAKRRRLHREQLDDLF